MDLTSYFDRVVVISLRRRPDRLERFWTALRACGWPFREPEVFHAVDGSLVPSPENWQSGGGAWGCMRSHQRILEDAMRDGVQRLLILEDDACFADDFADKAAQFLAAVPADWDQLMLGGQHVHEHGAPVLVRLGVFRCMDCERTHGYAVRGEFMKKLYRRWVRGGRFDGTVHCDWIMGRDPDLQRRHNVYAPVRFLIGQALGKSDISGRPQPEKFWHPPEPGKPVVHLQAPPTVVAALRRHGLHTGHHRDPVTDMEVKLVKTVGETGGNPKARLDRLRLWLEALRWEAAPDPFLVCAVWHPAVDAGLVRAAAQGPVIEVSAGSVAEALGQLPSEWRRPYRPQLAAECVIHLQAPSEVMEAMREHGWHGGHWREEGTGFDRGLCKLCAEHRDRDARIRALAEAICQLQAEAVEMPQGVAVVWHPAIDAGMVRSATRARVVAIVAQQEHDGLERWQQARAEVLATLAAEATGIPPQ